MKRVIVASTDEQKLVNAIDTFWELHPESNGASVKEIQEWVRCHLGIDATYKAIDEAWDAWASGYEADLIQKMQTVEDAEISTREEAASWLDSMIAEHGSTYHWSRELRAKLDSLIEQFGSTYFWRT